MLHVHVLISATTNPLWVEQCIASVDAAQRQAGFPVDVSYIDGVPGHIGRGRKAGYALAQQPYATYVDDDDYVEPHAFSCLAAAFEQRPAAIFTGETIVQNGHFQQVARRHHLQVTRTDMAQAFDFEPWTYFGDMHLKWASAKAPGGVIDVAEFPYIHRVYYGSASRAMRRANSAEMSSGKLPR